MIMGDSSVLRSTRSARTTGTTRMSIAAAAAVLPCVLALAACGSSSSGSANASSTGSAAAPTTSSAPANPNAGLSSTAVQNQIDTAVKSATALGLSGTMTSDGTTATIDIQLNQASSKGTLATGGMTIPFECIAKTCYIQFSASLIKSQGVDPSSATGKLMLNKWVSSDSSIGQSMASSFSPFENVSSFMDQLTSKSGDTLTAEGTTTLNGQTVAVYKDTDPKNGDTELYLPASGPALPVQESGTGANAGKVTFTWNQPTTVTAPPAADMFKA